MIAHFDAMPPAVARYFRSTLSDLLFKFERGAGFVRLPGSREWLPSQVSLEGMKAGTVEITAEEGEP